MQSLVFSYSQRQYTKAARAGVDAANLSLKDAREQVALDASTTYIELDTVNTELEAARQQESFANSLVQIEQQRAEAGVDSSMDLLQGRLTAAQIKLKRLHLETRAATPVSYTHLDVYKRQLCIQGGRRRIEEDPSGDRDHQPDPGGHSLRTHRRGMGGDRDDHRTALAGGHSDQAGYAVTAVLRASFLLVATVSIAAWAQAPRNSLAGANAALQLSLIHI